MGFLVSNTQSTFLGMSLGLAVFVFGAIQILEGIVLIVEWWDTPNDIVRYGTRTVAIINIVDGVTGISASLSTSVLLALTAAVGYAVDGLAHITLIALRWVAFIEYLETTTRRRSLAPTLYLRTVIGAIFSITVIVFTCFLVRTALTFYQVLLVGGTGWEKMSPGEMLDKEFGLLELDDYRRDETMMEEAAVLEAAQGEAKDRAEERVFI